MNILEIFKSKLPTPVSPNYNRNTNKLVVFFAEYLSNVQNVFKQIEYYRSVDKATGKTLDKLGEKVGETRITEDDNFYRIMIKSKFSSRKGETSVNGILTIIKNSMGIDVRNIKIIPVENEPQAVMIKDVPLNLVSEDWQQRYLLKRIESTVAAGIRVQEITFIDKANGTVKVLSGSTSSIIYERG